MLNISFKKVLSNKKCLLLGCTVIFNLSSHIANAECWFIKNYATNLYLDSNGDSIYTHVGNGGNFQKWEMIPAGDGSFHFINIAVHKALDGGDSPYPGFVNWGDFQRWILVTVNEDAKLYYIRQPISAKILDSNFLGQVYFNYLFPNNYQTWKFERCQD